MDKIPTYEKSTHLNPAEYVVHIFKGVRAAARLIGVNPSLVSRWKIAKDRKGAVGNIPTVHRKSILGIARSNGWDLNSEDLDFGRSVISQDQYE